jgi:tetratricopeptide (TPR) repeat protein
VSTADLAPTLLGLLGLDAHGTSGRDLGPLLAPGAEPAAYAATPDEALDAEAAYLETCHSLYSYGWSPLFALVAGDLKVVDGPSPAVYDLAADPGELRNLAAERPEALERARAAFRALAPLTEAGERIQLEEEDARALERLGYTAGVDDLGGARTTDALPPGRLDPQLADPGARIETKLLCELAITQLAAGEVESSVETIRRVLAQDPDNPIFLSQAGTVLITAGLHDEAQVALRRCLELREDPSARCSLAVALNLSGQRREAIETLRLNAELHPRHLHTRFALGEMLLEVGSAAEAEEQLRAFLAEHDADDPWHAMADRLATLARGEALLQEGDADAALDQLETFLAAHQAPDPWRQRALLLAERARQQLPD